MTETVLQNQIAKLLIASGYVVVRVNSGMFKLDKRYIRAYIIKNNGSSSGLPDLIAFKENKYIMLEVKKPGKGKISDSQKTFDKLAEFHRLNYYVVDSLNQVEFLL